MNYEVLKTKVEGYKHVILASLPDNTVTPWVTWRVDPNDYSNRFWGHYFREYSSAEKDFHAR